MSKTHQNIISKTHRVVIKVGSGLITNHKGLRIKFFNDIARQVSLLHARGLDVVLVSSGAIACGMDILSLKKRPSEVSKKQAAAALGQPKLMQLYGKAFTRYKIHVAQILLTRQELHNKKNYTTAKHTFTELFKTKSIPIINENDSVAVDEIVVGDNDQLSAMVAHLVGADLLIILSDIDGFYDSDPKKNPKASRLDVVSRIDSKTFSKAGGTLSQKSTGGMTTKLKAAQIAKKSGIATWLASGLEKDILKKIFSGKNVGTVFI
ncbi:glutamate 5-kinase [bacterium]|nr:glutamate 5-kinase [bacterium]